MENVEAQNLTQDTLVEKLVQVNRVATVSYTHLTLPTKA